MRSGLSRLVAAALAVVVLGACSSGSGGSGSGDGSAAGGAIRVGVSSMPPGLGDPFTGIGAQSVYTWSALFDPLTMVDESGTPQPWLATEWQNIDDTTWEFSLRDDVTFANGEKFDAEAVAATIEYLISETGSTSVVGSELSMLEATEVVDETTIRISTSTPDATLPARLSAVYIVAPDAWAELGPEGFAAAPVGTGPFLATSIDANGMEGEAFEESWRAPAADEFKVTMLADSAARLQALQSGQLDVAIALSPDQIPAIESSGGTVEDSPAPQVMSFAFVQTGEESPVQDQQVRLALNHAVDREAIAESIFGGLARPATQGSTPESFGYNEEITGYEYDPDLARTMLEEAGYGDGLDLKATVTVGSFPGDNEVYQAGADNLSDVGVSLEFETVQFAQWLERYQQSSWTTEMFNQSWNLAPVGDAIRPAMIFSCKKNNPFVCDESITELIDQINAEFDPDTRKGLLEQLAGEYHENPPSLLLIEQVDLNATGQGVEGFTMSSRFIQYEEITLG